MMLRVIAWLALVGSHLYVPVLHASERVPWTTSRLKGPPEAPLPYATEQVFPQATFVNPLALVHHAPLDQFFVLQLDGKLYSLRDQGDHAPILVVDLKQALPGLQRGYGVAFDPDFGNNGYIYLCYIYQNRQPNGTVVSRFNTQVNADGVLEIDIASKLELIRWRSGGHNGGCLKFGPDGYFYISTGDAEVPSPPDPLRTGQDVSDLLSSILRIDVSESRPEMPYRIPPDNPFVGRPNTRGEIWAYGLRNPWRMSFDTGTGDLWVGDVGWELWEMIYRVERGGNYGWSVTEGQQPVYPDEAVGPTPILLPTAEHPHSEARSITGGFVYHGSRLPELKTRYIYGDYVTGRLWSLPDNAGPLTKPEPVAISPLQIICFGQDDEGEVYAVGYVSGTIHRLIPNPERKESYNFPEQLRDTGLFSDVSAHALAPGVYPYSIQAEPWEDGAIASRFIAVPGNETLGRYRRNRLQQGEVKDEWSFPDGTILGKTIKLNTGNETNPTWHRVETQILHRHESRWWAYSYAWNQAQDSAKLVPAAGARIQLSEGVVESESTENKSPEWRIVSRTECILCHTIQAGNVLGFNERQLAGDKNGAHHDQLAKFVARDFFDPPPSRRLKAFVSPHDPRANLNDRARSYLHVNCAQCHRFGGGGTAIFDLRYELDNEQSKLFASPPIQGTFGITGAQVVAPQDPAASLLFYRVAKLGQGRMPHFGARTIDHNGLQLLHEWINSLPTTLSVAESSGAVEKLRLDQSRHLQAYRRANDPSSEQAQDSASELLATPSGALTALAHATSINPSLSSAHRDFLIRTGAAHADVRTRDLFRQFTDDSDRPETLGLSTDLAPILALPGDGERGARLVLERTDLRCLDCHTFNGKGREVGPSFAGLGARLTRREILEALLQPSARIAPEYTPKMIETHAGDIYSGFLIDEANGQVAFRDILQGDVTIPREEIQVMETQSLSLMPQYLLQELTAAEAADLLAFLVSLK